MEMKKRMRLFCGLIIGLLFCLFAVSAEATFEAFKLFKETYPGKKPTYYTCAVCHTGKIGKKGELNPYGQSLGLVLPAKLTVEQLKAAESLDPDKDGVPSGKEIETGTLPGDAASHP